MPTRTSSTTRSAAIAAAPAARLGAALSRRQFLALAGAAPFAGPLLSAAAPSPVPVGIELFTVRTALAKDLMGTVRAVAKMGYQVVEFFSPYYDWTPQMASDVRKLMDDVGLRALSTHNGAKTFTPDGLQKAIDLNQAIGSRCLVMASPGGEITSIDGWKAVGDRLNAAADKLAPLGMTAGYHNHASEWRAIDGQRPMDVLAAQTRKEVTLQLDLGTCVEAGADPIAWIKANPGRIRSLHCKDWSRTKGYGVLFGEGDVPWANVFTAAESAGGVEFYLVEQEEGPAEQQLQRAEQCLANWKKMRA